MNIITLGSEMEQVPEASTSKWICLKLVSSWDLKQAHLGSWYTALGSNGD